MLTFAIGAHGAMTAHFSYDYTNGVRQVDGGELMFTYDAAWTNVGINAMVYDDDTILANGVYGCHIIAIIH